MFASVAGPFNRNVDSAVRVRLAECDLRPTSLPSFSPRDRPLDAAKVNTQKTVIPTSP